MLSFDSVLRKKQTVLVYLSFILRVALKGLLQAFMDFIFKRLECRDPDGSLQIMYTIHGRRSICSLILLI